MSTIIGLAGPKGVGKSTYANQLVFDMVSEKPCTAPDLAKIRIISFATPLKEMLGCIVHQDYIDDKERVIPNLGVSARHCLQTLGTEWGRNIHPDIWINITKHRMEESDAKIFIIDDVRFDNEAEMICEMGGEVWKLSRSGVKEDDNHISESGISDNLITKNVNLDSLGNVT
jgi:septin family protein